MTPALDPDPLLQVARRKASGDGREQLVRATRVYLTLLERLWA